MTKQAPLYHRIGAMDRGFRTAHVHRGCVRGAAHRWRTTRASSDDSVTALLWAPVTWALMTLAGADLGWALPLWVSALLAPVGFAYPSLSLRSKAADRRRSFRHAFSAGLHSDARPRSAS